MQCRAVPDTADITLTWKGDHGREYITSNYFRLTNGTRLNKDATKGSPSYWVTLMARDLTAVVGAVLKGYFGTRLKTTAYQNRYFITVRQLLLMSVVDCIALQGHVGMVNKGLYQLK